MSDLQSTDKRKRAIRIRQLAIGFNDDTSRSMIELAKELEAAAAAEEAQRPDGHDPESTSVDKPE